MERLQHKAQNVARRKNRVRAKITGTTDRPRLSVYISHQHVTAQIIDDSTHKTLVYISTVGQKAKGTMTEKAASVGTEVAKQAKTAKIKRVVLDRNGRLYHGRIKA